MPLPVQAVTRLTILDAGPYTTVQDAGRAGHQALGVPEGGAMDEDARICGNWLVGNPADAAGLETYMGGLEIYHRWPYPCPDRHAGDSLQVTCADGHIQEVAAGCSIHLSGGERVLSAAYASQQSGLYCPFRGAGLAKCLWLAFHLFECPAWRAGGQTSCQPGQREDKNTALAATCP